MSAPEVSLEDVAQLDVWEWSVRVSIRSGFLLIRRRKDTEDAWSDVARFEHSTDAFLIAAKLNLRTPH